MVAVDSVALAAMCARNKAPNDDTRSAQLYATLDQLSSVYLTPFTLGVLVSQ